MTLTLAGPTSPQPRTGLGRCSDAALTRALRLPPPTSDYTVTRGLRVPMRDGIDLLADHYAPVGAASGALLIRGPYGRSGLHPYVFARMYAERGYHVVLQSCRGTFGSGGQFQPMAREIEDGADTVAWLRRRPWFPGRFATLGLSYLGFTQWALLMEPPPELVTAVVMVGPHDMGEAVHGTGAFTLSDFLGWSDMVAHQEDGGPLRGLVRAATAPRRLAPALAQVSLLEAGEAVLQGRAAWYGEWAARDDPADPFWQRMHVGAALDRVEVPVLLVGGWQDIFLRQTLDQYRRLAGRGVDVALTMGPWTHLDMVGRASRVVSAETLDWLAEHLAGTGTRRRRDAVHVFVTGAGTWRGAPEWPPPGSPRVLYLHPGGRLADEPPPESAPPSSFTYDPADPTPTVGGRLLNVRAGYRDQRRLEARDDVLVFTGPVLADGLEIAGSPVVELVHGSDNPHADVFARICEVDAKGRSRNVSETMVRLRPGREDAVVRLELDPVAHRFRAGTRIRLQVSGGSHPRWARNLGTGEPAATGTRMAPSHRTVAHGAGGVSRVLLPVPDPPLAEDSR